MGFSNIRGYRMSKICKKCGKNIPNDGAHFCPECGFSINEKTGIADRLRNSEDDWVKNLLWINDGQKRVSKAKLAGIVIFVLYIFSAILTSGEYLRIGFIPFAFMMMVSLVAGIVYYCLCRGIGFVIRKVMN